MEQLLASLRAAGESTRLRILAILARAELTVSEMTRVLGQSQPRVSRHLKLLCDAGLLERAPEGAWAFFRLTHRGNGAELARVLLSYVPDDDPTVIADLERLRAVQREHAEAADRYFRRAAAKWDEIRRLYVAEADVERAMLDVLGDRDVDEFLDLGTGTGRILQVFGPRVRHATGIDSNREMLALARVNLDRAGLRHCQVRHGDIYRLSVPSGSVDLVTVHHVLHFLDDPAAAVAEAARTLRPGGRLIVVDFAPHALETLRTEHAHRRLGFDTEEVAIWYRAAGIENVDARHLAASGASGPETLTVTIWSGIRGDEAHDETARAVA